MATAKKPSTAKKKTTAKKPRQVATRTATPGQQEYSVRVKLGIILFILLAFSFLLIVLTKYQ